MLSMLRALGSMPSISENKDKAEVEGCLKEEDSADGTKHPLKVNTKATHNWYGDLN